MTELQYWICRLEGLRVKIREKFSCAQSRAVQERKVGLSLPEEVRQLKVCVILHESSVGLCGY